jgi:nucleoside-diphosphate-sugar epimerase
MRILVTGARGKVGAAAVDALVQAGHEVVGCDLTAPAYEGGERVASYVQADLTVAGDAFATVHGCDAVIHAAAIPEPTQNTPATVFRNNLMATFNVAEACVRLGIGRLVNLSSETVPGMGFAARPFFAPYAPIDEELANRPQDPYALSKLFGEQLMDAAVARSDLRAISIRPTWVQWEGNYARSLGPWLRDPLSAPPSQSFWSYIDAYDLADALRLAAESSLDGHEVMYIASPDNATGRPLRALIAHHFGDAVEVRGEPDSGISIDKARRLLGYAPSRSWRDYLTPEGELLDAARERLERGETGVQRGRAALG